MHPQDKENKPPKPYQPDVIGDPDGAGPRPTRTYPDGKKHDPEFPDYLERVVAVPELAVAAAKYKLGLDPRKPVGKDNPELPLGVTGIVYGEKGEKTCTLAYDAKGNVVPVTMPKNLGATPVKVINPKTGAPTNQSFVPTKYLTCNTAEQLQKLLKDIENVPFLKNVEVSSAGDNCDEFIPPLPSALQNLSKNDTESKGNSKSKSK